VAAAAVWNGWFAYRSGRFDRAALYQASVAAHSGQPVQRIDAALSATSNWMEWGDLARSRRVARKALTQARSLRVPELEARAEWLVRAVAYRAEESLEVDTELIEAVGDLRCCNVRALVLLNEAAIAWRNGELGRTADLATRAAEDWERLGNECASTLARALAAASAKRHGDDFELIRQGTAQCVAPDLQVQALALLGLAYPEYKPELREIAVRSVAGWHGPKNRLDVLSVRESLMYLSD
jgi:hypothetical protein